MVLPVTTEDYRRTDIQTPAPTLSGLDAAVYGLAGRYRRRSTVTAGLLEQAEQVDARSADWKELSDQALRRRLAEFKEIFCRNGAGHEEHLLDALAAIREAAERQLGLRPYVVQLAGALALHRGTVAEMATGEGKTLTAGMAAVLWGWSGRPCHVITANDYLAERDADWLTSFFGFCGITAGTVTSQMVPHVRREQYRADVTYTTSKELLADFLRDRLRLDNLQDVGRRQVHALAGRARAIEGQLVMRGIHSAIVDEVDSILIDEAVTPLIISRQMPNEPFVEACREASQIAEGLEAGTDYRVDLQFSEIDLLPRAEERLAQTAQARPGPFRGRGQHRELVQQALKAREFFHRDAQYVIHEGKVVIVDEFTGRLMPQRTWSTGLHQLIEAKEGISLTSPSETLARLSFQRFFRCFHRLAGMTGTANEAAGELWQIYGMPVVAIPPNRPCQRTVLPRRFFARQEEKWTAITDEVEARHAKGQPVLVGTRSVKASEELAQRLAERGLFFRVLNAIHHGEEARIVSRAGETGAITVATNMAGRGTDIKLEREVIRLGGLHVIATECHESARIDRQLFGRCARQGDPGSALSFVSRDDELLRRYAPAPARRAVTAVLERRMPGTSLSAQLLLRRAQNRAQRLAFQRRRSVLRTDTWLEDSLSFAQQDVAS